MEDREAQAIFSQILNIGENMLRAGGEVYRVEDTINRLIIAYGGEKPHVFAIPSNIIATAVFNGTEITHSRRVVTPSIDFEMLDRMNDLARQICRDKPSSVQVKRMIDEAMSMKKYNHFWKSVTFALVSSSFALFFGGSFMDAVSSAVIGVVLYGAMNAIRAVGGNVIFVNIICAAISALLALTSVKLGIAQDADKIIIGNVMLLIPGVELVNGMRDFIAGDVQAGIMHITEALFLAICIAIGAAGVLTLIGGAHI